MIPVTPTSSDPLSFRVRKVESGDTSAITAIEFEVFEAESYNAVTVRQLIEVGGRCSRVAMTDDGRLLGYVLSALADDARTGCILALAVTPSQRCQGMGSALFAETVEALNSIPVARMLVTVHPENSSAIRIYKQAGFTVEQSISDYFGPGETRLLMERRSSAGPDKLPYEAGSAGPCR